MSYDTSRKTEKLPRSFNDLRELVVAQTPDLPRRLAQIATYAIENPDDIAFGTVASVARAAGVQPSSLVRFAQSLGYEGFSDIQEVFRSRLRDNRLPGYDERIAHLRALGGDGARLGLVLDGFLASAEKSIATLRQGVDLDRLEEVTGIMARARTIYVTGYRRSFPVSSYVAYALGKLGARNVLVDGTGGLSLDQMRFATPEDCLLAVSFEPYSAEALALVELASTRNVSVVALTDSPFSPLAARANAWVEIREADFEGFRSLTATLILAMTLAVGVAEKRNRTTT